MPTDKRIDAYIENAQPFAQPILRKIRVLMHKACPDVTETIKWGMPSFEYKGPMFGMAAFKQHCAGGFWKTALLKDPGNYLGKSKNRGGEAMGNLGCVKSVKDLPPDNVFIDFIKQHMKLNEAGIKLEKVKSEKKEIPVPDDFAKALNKNKKAKSVFEKFAPSHKREYLQWITEAKREETRLKRITTAIEWIAEGKGRNWKYERK